MTTETHKFKKGQELHLDEIYNIQALGGGDWWEAVPDGTIECPDTSGELVRIIRDTTIKITVTQK